jgi:hypothetical protein
MQSMFIALARHIASEAHFTFWSMSCFEEWLSLILFVRASASCNSTISEIDSKSIKPIRTTVIELFRLFIRIRDDGVTYLQYREVHYKEL